MNLLLKLSLLICLANQISAQGVSIDTIAQWKQMDFGFPTAEIEAQIKASGNFSPSSSVLIDMNPQYKENGDLRIFVTLPRFRSGYPYSLATVEAGGKIQPYPNLESHNSDGTNCNVISSAFRVIIDPCNQMWVIDSGYINEVQLCPAQLLLFDLNTDTLVHQFTIPRSVSIWGATKFINIALKVNDPAPGGKCLDTTVFLADNKFHGLVVYDRKQNLAWRSEHMSMYPDPDYINNTILGQSFTIADGTFALSVNGEHLYLHAFCSVSEYRIPLSVLADSASFIRSVSSHATSFEKVITRPSPAAATASDDQGNLYWVEINPIQLRSWNPKDNQIKTLSTNTELLQFVGGMKVVKNPKGHQELWMSSNRFQKVASGTQNPNEINYRIVRVNLGTQDLSSLPQIQPVAAQVKPQSPQVKPLTPSKVKKTKVHSKLSPSKVKAG